MSKGCFQHDTANEDIKNLHRRIASDKVLCDRIFMIHNVDLLQRFINVLIKFLLVVLLLVQNKSAIGSEIMHNQQVAEKLHKPII